MVKKGKSRVFMIRYFLFDNKLVIVIVKDVGSKLG